MEVFSEKLFLDKLFEDLESEDLMLPTLPEVALKVRDILADDDSSLSDVAKTIAQDISLSAKIIQIVNSPLLRTGKTIENISSAVNLLGGNMTRNIVTNMAMQQMFQAKTNIVDSRLRKTWNRSVEVSSIAYALCSGFCENLKADQAMLAGLVHDIGVLPILTRAEDYPELLNDEEALDRVVSNAHTRMGAAILEKWCFPEEIIVVAREHENYQYDSALTVYDTYGQVVPDYVDIVIVAGLQAEEETENGAVENQKVDWSSVPSFKKLGLATDVEVIDISMDGSMAMAMAVA